MILGTHLPTHFYMKYMVTNLKTKNEHIFVNKGE